MLHVPVTAARGAVVVCHPHPQYGGDMWNPVVVAVAYFLALAGFAALRFDFGGVGASEGRYGEGREEQCDVGAAEAALAARLPGVSCALVGYSFGAWVAAMAARGLPRVRRMIAIGPPLTFFAWDFAAELRAPLDVVVGDRDQFCPPDALARLRATVAHRTAVLAGADHFLAGREGDAARAVLGFLEA